MTPRPQHMPSMPIGELRSALPGQMQRHPGEHEPVTIEVPGRSLSLHEIAVSFRNGFFVFVLKAGNRALKTAADLREAVIFAMQGGGAYGQNLHESKQAIIEVPDGRMFSLAEVSCGRSGALVLKAGAQWPPEEFR